MTSRDRVLTALAHREPDQIPFDLSATPMTGIHRIAYTRLREALGLEPRPIQIYHLMQQLAIVDEDVHETLRTDVRGSRPHPPPDFALEIADGGDGYEYTRDEWGMGRRRSLDGGLYFDLCDSALGDARTPADILAYSWPDVSSESRIGHLPQTAQAIRDTDKAFILGGICPGMMEMGQWLRGFDNFYCDLAADRALAEALCDRIIDLKIEYWEAALPRVGHLVDVIQEGDDYGGQTQLLCRPEVWREIFKPRLRRLFSTIKGLAPHAPIFFHSCGAVRSIIPDLIEVGVDILNPVQVAADDMDSADLKREFGDDLSFWGGGVDTQSVLPNGSVMEVQDEVKRRIDDLAPGGGFVFAAVHNIQSDVPPENILALRETLDTCGVYGDPATAS
jgi:uroporphyrinogen decarboxylase